MAAILSSGSSITPSSLEYEECGPTATWELQGGYVLYILIMLYVFFAFAILCDDFFVPALNVVCEKFKVPEDLAGATLMAAGASSPELFSSFVGVVITGTPVGTGTVVGSELFNMLCICGGAALVSHGGLTLRRTLLARDASFYLLSLITLVVVLHDHQVYWWDSGLLLLGYILYVTTCALWRPVLRRCGVQLGDERKKLQIKQYLSIAAPAIQLDSQGSSDTEGCTPGTLRPGRASGFALGLSYGEVLMHGFLFKKSRFYSKIRWSSQQWQQRWFILTPHEFRYCKSPLQPDVDAVVIDLVNARSLQDISDVEFELRTPEQNFVLRASSPAVKEQWTSLLDQVIEHFQDHAESGKPVPFSSSITTRYVPHTGWFSLGQQPHEDDLEAVFSGDSEAVSSETTSLYGLVFNSELYLRSAELRSLGSNAGQVFRNWPIDEDLLRRQVLAAEEGRLYECPSPTDPKTDLTNLEDDPEHPGILRWPENAVRRALFVFAFPLLVLFHFTVPDVRRKRWNRWWPVTVLMCIVYFAGLALMMIHSAERTACILHIPLDIMGITICAAGTSLPNLFSGVLAARQGFGSMCVANAFGSNIFNIFIALGLPWFIACTIVSPGQSYSVPSGKIFFSVLFLIVSLVAFLIIVAISRFKIGWKAGVLFLVFYALWLVYQILVVLGVIPDVFGG